MSFVGLDVGGTFLKAARLSPLGEPLHVVRRPIPPFLDVSGAAREIDATVLMAGVRSVLDEVLSADPGKAVTGVLVTGQMAGLAFVDEAGRAQAPLISWQDTRVDRIAEVQARLGEEALGSLGDGLRVGLPLITLQEIRPPAGSRVTSLIAYVAGSLAQTWARAVHTTDAAAWGMLDVARGAWHPEAVRVAGLSVDELPAVAGHVVPVGGAGFRGVPVFCAVGDQQASLLGAGLEPQELSVNLATGCQVSMVSDEPSSPAQLRPYVDGRFLRTVTHLPAGRLLTAALTDALGHEPAEADWGRAATAVVAGEPRLAGVKEAVGQIAGACADAALRVGGIDATRIRFSGGLVQQFTPLQEAIASRIGLPAVVYEGDDAALAGLGRLSLEVAA